MAFRLVVLEKVIDILIDFYEKYLSFGGKRIFYGIIIKY